MFNRGLSLAMAAATMMAAPFSSPQALQAAPGLDPGEGLRLGGRKGKGDNNRRGRGKQARPRKRPNMRHVSKRVRRKHRRNR